ncbi:MAG: hypothetical protein RTV72_12490 [Candidatus Thorarchaeota archaeon]
MSNPFEHARPSQNSLPEIHLVGESILYDIFRKGGEFTGERITKLERMFHSTLRQMDRCKNDASPYPGIETPLELAVQIYTTLIGSYVELAVPILPPAVHDKFLIAPEAFISSGEHDVAKLVRRKFELLTLSHCNSWNLSKVMIKLVRAAVAADLQRKKMH